jgi:nucleoside-diphosphate-sugar epimerase
MLDRSTQTDTSKQCSDSSFSGPVSNHIAADVSSSGEMMNQKPIKFVINDEIRMQQGDKKTVQDFNNQNSGLHQNRRDFFQFVAKTSLCLIPIAFSMERSAAATETLNIPFKSILIIGCGFIGKHVAENLKSMGVAKVSATTTSPNKIDTLLQVVDDVIVIPPVTDGDDTILKTAIAQHEAILIAVGPGDSNQPSSYDTLFVGTALRVVSALKSKRTPTNIGMISSCGVYGSYSHGELVNEESPPLEPSADARALIEAERLLTEAKAKANGLIKLTILRPTGLWGGQDRDLFPMVSRVSQIGVPLPESMGAGYLSFAHVDDVCGAYLWCVSKGLQGPFNVASPSFTRRDFFDTLCDVYQLNKIAWKPTAASKRAAAPVAEAGEGERTAVEADTRGGNKRVDCSRLLATGYRFKVPDTFQKVYDDQAAWRLSIINRRRKALGEALLEGLPGYPAQYPGRGEAQAARGGM